MNIAFTKMINNLYGITITDKQSILDADAAIRQSFQNQNWAESVAAKLNIRQFIVNVPEHANFHSMKKNATVIPRIDGRLNNWVDEIFDASNRMAALDKISKEIAQLLALYKEQNYPGVMTTLPHYDSSSHETYSITTAKKDEIMMILLHEICKNVEQHHMFLQFFLGVERSWARTAPAPVNDPERVVKLYGLFEQYDCTFELVVASELNNLDVVQAAWNFPNVSVGGLWWYNFRTSTYRDSMQYRLEALPAMKSSFIVSDARCIEWAYGKILVVKQILAEFLWERIESGWIDEKLAIQVAKDWLSESAKKRYSLIDE